MKYRKCLSSEGHFSTKSNVIDHPDLVLNKNIAHKALSQKHLGLILEDKLNFKEHINKKLCKAKKSIGILRKLYHFIPRSALLTIYKTFICIHLDYGDIIYDQPCNGSFSSKIESVQYNIALTGQYQGNKEEIKGKTLPRIRT